MALAGLTDAVIRIGRTASSSRSHKSYKWKDGTKNKQNPYSSIVSLDLGYAMFALKPGVNSKAWRRGSCGLNVQNPIQLGSNVTVSSCHSFQLF